MQPETSRVETPWKLASVKKLIVLSTLVVSPKMIIPIRCFSCNNVIGDMWNYYQKEIKKRRGSSNPDDRFYMDGSQIPQTLEMEILTKLGIKRPCCRAKFLTHVPLIDKIN